jgi:hypothetical protein
MSFLYDKWSVGTFRGFNFSLSITSHFKDLINGNNQIIAILVNEKCLEPRGEKKREARGNGWILS